jgi:hypothetical protein
MALPGRSSERPGSSTQSGVRERTIASGRRDTMSQTTEPMQRLVLALLLVVLAGCHSYRRMESPAPMRGEQLRIELTDQGSVDVTGQVGPRAITIFGRLTESSGDSLAVAVTGVERRTGTTEIWQGERVSLGRSSIASISRQAISWRRTSLLVAAGVAAYFLLAGFGDWEGLVGGGKNGGGPPSGQ